ncbi:MAG: hypothetical protein FWH04_02775 [Oscillospiraceae bacterium]|nr:hypothetical protein [Oscillospiraceae bacterium]
MIERFDRHFRKHADRQLIQAIEEADRELEEAMDEFHQIVKSGLRSVASKGLKYCGVMAGKALIGTVAIGLSVGVMAARAGTSTVIVDRYGNRVP